MDVNSVNYTKSSFNCRVFMLKRHFSLKSYLILFLISALLTITGCAKNKPVKENIDANNRAMVDSWIKQSQDEFKQRKQFLETQFADKLPESAQNGAVWILIDTQKMLLEVKRGLQTLAIFKNISIGRNGAGFKNQRGDDITPLGIYKIGWINDKSIYHTFYGFTYPSIEDAKTALEKNLISETDYTSIITAHQNGQIPPQYTPLGGRIGLHGIGQGNEEIHRQMNWTHGCIAITNEQIDELSQWLAEGIEVKVK